METRSTNFHTYKNNINKSKFKHNILKISISLMFCLSFSISVAASIPYSGGSGTVDNPYLLSIDSDIDTLSVTSADWDSNFTLTQNITLVGNHIPIGNLGTAFTGDFNGNGFAVKNLTVYQTTRFAGFFGYAGSGANIHDLGVEASSDGVVSTDWYVGVLAGRNSGTVNNCYATGNATGDTRVGGLAGRNEGTVTNSYATGNATGNLRVGGLIGHINTEGNVSNCYATGNATGRDYVGGLAGYTNGIVSNCFATGNATGNSSVGGLIGYIRNGGTVTNCFATGDATGNSSVGGMIGSNNGTVSNSYYSGTPNTDPNNSTSFANFTCFTFVSGSSGLNWNESDNNFTTANDSGFIWKMVNGYTLPYFQYQDMPAPLAPYIEDISLNSGFNNSIGSTSFLLNVTGSCFNIADTVFVNLTMAGQTPISGTIDNITYTTINTTFNLTQVIAGDWSLYVINPDGQISIAKTFTIGTLFIAGTPESFINTTGNFWVKHSWSAGAGDITDSYNVSYNGTWLNGTTNSFNHTELDPHAWSNITVYAFNATDSTFSAGASDKVQVPNNDVSILNVTDITVNEGENITFNINSTDLDGDTPRFDCNRSSLIDTFNTSTGKGSWNTSISDAGTYYIEFNLSDGYGSIDSQVMTITINDTITPVANFSANTVTGYAPLSVQFTDNSSNIPTSWFWDFGDGTNSTLQNPVHTYSAAGIYNVSLNASNFAGSNLSNNITITVTTASSSGGGSGRRGNLVIREANKSDKTVESTGEDNTENIGSVSFETDTCGETVAETQDADTQSAMSMSWLRLLLPLLIVGGAGYYIIHLMKKV
jgi:hypothetical protein